MPVQVITAGGAKNPSNAKPKLPSSRPRSKEQQNRSDDDGSAPIAIKPLIVIENTGTTEQASAEVSVQKQKSPRRVKTPTASEPLDALYKSPSTEAPVEESTMMQNMWLLICFFGIMLSFICYGLLLEYATSGGRKLHELSFLFVTSGLYTLTAAAGRHVRDEKPSSIPPARFAVLGLTSMGSTFCSVRSLRYVIYPIQVLAKSCKPVPVMLMGALMGKKYPARKYFNVALIVSGVALFMGG
jgi:hypothetical protein